MILYNLLVIINLIWLLINITAFLCSNYFFKLNNNKYERLLQDYQSAGLQLDAMTTLASHFGFMMNYQKIAFFMRLYRSEKIKFSSSEYVHQESYDFIRNQPKENIEWMVKLRRWYLINAWSMGLLIFSMFLMRNYIPH